MDSHSLICAYSCKQAFLKSFLAMLSVSRCGNKGLFIVKLMHLWIWCRDLISSTVKYYLNLIVVFNTHNCKQYNILVRKDVQTNVHQTARQKSASRAWLIILLLSYLALPSTFRSMHKLPNACRTPIAVHSLPCKKQLFEITLKGPSLQSTKIHGVLVIASLLLIFLHY